MHPLRQRHRLVLDLVVLALLLPRLRGGRKKTEAEGAAEEQRHEQLRMARAIVQAVANYDQPGILAQLSEGLPKAMKGIAVETLPAGDQLAKRGW